MYIKVLSLIYILLADLCAHQWSWSYLIQSISSSVGIHNPVPDTKFLVSFLILHLSQLAPKLKILFMICQKMLNLKKTNDFKSIEMW